MHGIESMGQWDGMWLGSSPAFPIGPDDRRYFETYPRLGDPRVRPREVVIDDNGLLQLLIDSKPSASNTAEAGGVEDRKQALLDRLRDAADGLWTKEVCRT